MKEQLFQILSVAAVICFFIPLIVVLIRRLWYDKGLRYFALYWSFTGVVNGSDHFLSPSLEVRETVNVIYNMLDIPFLLFVLYLNTLETLKRQFIVYAAVIYLVVLALAISLKGINYNSGKYPLGLGLIIVLTIVIWSIIDYMMKLRHSRRERAMLYIYSAILFQFGTFIIIYVFDYFLVGSSYVDTFLVYYTSSIIALVIAIFGLTRPRIGQENSWGRKNLQQEPGMIS